MFPSYAKRLAGHALSIAILLIVGWLGVRAARKLNWSDVGGHLSEVSVADLALTALAMIIGYAATSSYDLLGRRYTGHSLGVARTMLTSFTGYALSLNLGALVGGIGLRYRLYSRAGLRRSVTSKIIGLTILTNWSGYALLAGLVLSLAAPDLPGDLRLSPIALRLIGGACLVIGGVYLWLCWRRPVDRFELKDVELPLPRPKTAALQFVLSSVSWLALASIPAILLPEGVGTFRVLTTVLVASIAGVLAHVPGGIGVTELVFLAMLGGVVDDAEIVAALLLFRAAYYFLPLLLAIPAYLWLDLLARRSSA